MDGGVTMLTPAELSRVNEITESPAFRREMETGDFNCNPGPGRGPSIYLARESVPSSSGPFPNVTGCIFAGPSGNDALVLWNILQGRPDESDAGP
jgi:hypothetical protein